MKAQIKKPPIIIIGMHRSGTSLLSQLLEKAGVFMGWHKDENNEALFFLKFNDWILKQANASWDNPYNYTIAGEDFRNLIVKIALKYIGSIRRLEYLGFQNFFKYNNLQDLDFYWGWKDPRNTFTLDIWLKIFPSAKIIHIYRNPIDVAESLKKRCEKLKLNFKWNWKKELKLRFLAPIDFFHLRYVDSIRVCNLWEGIKLWEEYIERIFNLEKNINTKILHIKYEALLESTTQNLSEIFNFIKFKITSKQLEKLSKSINSERKFAFLKNEMLVDIYKKIRTKENLIKLGYDNII